MLSPAHARADEARRLLQADGPLHALIFPDGEWVVLGGELRREPQLEDAPALHLLPFPGPDGSIEDEGPLHPSWAVWCEHGDLHTAGDVPDIDPQQDRSLPRVGPWGEGDVDEATWGERIDTARRFAAGHPQGKIVIARTLRAPITHQGHAGTLARALQEAHPRATTVLLAPRPDDVWLAATPEPLVEVRGRLVNTVALAGTREPGGLWRTKEVLEHAPVADHVRDVLTATCDRVDVTGPTTVQAGPVEHLCTVLRAALPDDVAPMDLARALHPTPAVAGTPLEAAIDLIPSLEPEPRGLYTGAVGVQFPTGTYRSVVMLRSVHLGPDEAVVHTGAGITKRSRADEEWRETDLKARTITRVLGAHEDDA